MQAVAWFCTILQIEFGSSG